jgi:SAM-dependent methyltransferase
MMSAYAVSQLIYAAAVLKLPDLLDAGPISVSEISSRLSLNEDALVRTMRGLVVAGVAVAEEDGRYRGTALNALLVSTAPGSMRPLALLGDQSYRAWGDLVPTLQTGGPAFDRCFGISRFEFLTQHPDTAVAFNDAMATMAAQNAAAVVGAYDFSRSRQIVDVGGGTGVLMRAMLGGAPGATGVLFETEAVAPHARERIAAAGLADRCEVAAGDFLAAVPPGGDTYVLSQTIHNWDNGRAIQILRSCRDVMNPDGVVLVIEMLMPARLAGTPMDYPLVMTDLHMLVMTGGKERTEEEHRALLHAAGLRLRTVIRTKGPLAILEAVAE